jgi:hypothetical protein
VALSADQQAMLQLLLERGQRYADLASVLGVDEAEVRSRAREALTELGGADPDRNVGLTDYLLGQADPIGRADAVRHLKDDPGDLSLATELSQKLLLVAPEADLPRLPGEERPARPRRRRSSAGGRQPILERLRGAREPTEGAAAGRMTLTRRQAQLSVLLGCVAVLVVVGVLAITGTFGGGSDNTTPATTTASGNQRLASVKLKPPSGGNASGAAVFGVAGGSQLYVDVKLTGLPPAPKGQAYVMWFLLTASQGYPVPSVLNLSKGGSYSNRITIPAAEIPIAQRARSIDISLAPVQDVEAAINTAFKQRRLVQKPGVTVLSGQIPASRTGGGTGAGGANG